MREWTDSEDEVLRQHYLSKPRDWPEWDELLPGRSAKSRKSRAIRLGMRLREVSRVGTRSRVTDEQILQAIDGYWEDCGFAPCVRDVMDAVGFQSPSTIKYRLDELERTGKITREPKIPRSLKVVR